MIDDVAGPAGREPAQPALSPGVDVGLQFLPEVDAAVVIPQLESGLAGGLADSTGEEGLVVQ